MTKNTRQIIAAFIISTACSLTACTAPVVKEDAIPSDNIDITEAVKILDVPQKSFESFLSVLDMSYNEYMTTLKNGDRTLEDIKKSIEDTYNCDYKEYIETVLAVNTAKPPDKTYNLFKSEFSSIDAYIPIDELNNDKNRLSAYDIDINVADNSEDAYAFDAIIPCQGDFKTYINVLNQLYGCSSVEFTNITIYGSYGITKPEKPNACMDYLFVYDERTNEILKPISLSVMTMHNDDDSKTITMALSNELGLLFKTTGTDSYEKMLKISNLEFRICDSHEKTDETDTEINSETTTVS